MRTRLSIAVALGLLSTLLAPVAAARTTELTVVPEPYLVCTTCHGTDFRGNRAVDAPRLAGLSEWYVAHQMRAFRAGWRGTHPEDLIGMEMHPQAQHLSDEQIDEVAALIAGIAPPSAPEATIQGDRAAGEQLYTACAACHGAAGEGNEALNAPALVGQNDWYLAHQLAKYRSGARGFAAEDQSGATMRAATAVLTSEADTSNVVAYINTFAAAPAATTDGETSMKKLAAVPLLVAATAAGSADAEVKRYALPGSDFPIAQAVEITAGTTLVYHSGMTPRPANPEAKRYSAEFWGDTEAQTLSVFARLEESLKTKGLDFSNVVKMQVFLVGVPELSGAMDFQGMMRAYRKYFGTEEQPNLPARSAFQVAGLAAPGMLVEIEVVLAR